MWNPRRLRVLWPPLAATGVALPVYPQNRLDTPKQKLLFRPLPVTYLSCKQRVNFPHLVAVACAKTTMDSTLIKTCLLSYLCKVHEKVL
jgi:hypothetical protein